MNRLAATMVAGTLLAFSMMAASQTAGAQTAAAPAASDKDPHVISSQDLAMLRKDIRSQKKQLMARNLTLSDTDATKFWPIYDQYTAELTKINDKKYSTIQEFADHFGSMTDAQGYYPDPAVAGRGHCGDAAARQVPAHRDEGDRRPEWRQLGPAGPAHPDDGRPATGLADAAGAGPGTVVQGSGATNPLPDSGSGFVSWVRVMGSVPQLAAATLGAVDARKLVLTE